MTRKNMLRSFDRIIAGKLQRFGKSVPWFWNFFARFALYAFIIAGVCFAWFMPFAEWLTRLVLPAIGCYIATLLVQLVIRRKRPQILPHGFKLWINTYSFPSAHASSSFACAVLLSATAVRVVPETVVVFIPAVFLVAFGITLSRVVVGVHYPSDVVAGAFLGSALAFLTVLA